jgi:hypothetical protein
MATLQQQIAEQFLARIEVSKEFDSDKVAQLRALLAQGKKAKPEDFVNASHGFTSCPTLNQRSCDARVAALTSI